MDSSSLSHILHSFKLRVTETRLQILNVLIDSQTALCHHDIAEQMRSYSIDKVTIYRTLDAFEKKGLIHKVATKDRNWKYAICLNKKNNTEINRSHAHFICDHCDRIYCMPIQGLDNLPEVPSPDEFKITEKELRLHGLCPECLKHSNLN